jgi:hypothetical protein
MKHNKLYERTHVSGDFDTLWRIIEISASKVRGVFSLQKSALPSNGIEISMPLKSSLHVFNACKEFFSRQRNSEILLVLLLSEHDQADAGLLFVDSGHQHYNARMTELSYYVNQAIELSYKAQDEPLIRNCIAVHNHPYAKYGIAPIFTQGILNSDGTISAVRRDMNTEYSGYVLPSLMDIESANRWHEQPSIPVVRDFVCSAYGCSRYFSYGDSDIWDIYNDVTKKEKEVVRNGSSRVLPLDNGKNLQIKTSGQYFSYSILSESWIGDMYTWIKDKIFGEERSIKSLAQDLSQKSIEELRSIILECAKKLGISENELNHEAAVSLSKMDEGFLDPNSVYLSESDGPEDVNFSYILGHSVGYALYFLASVIFLLGAGTVVGAVLPLPLKGVLVFVWYKLVISPLSKK